jgi:hypothetical protein
MSRLVDAWATRLQGFSPVFLAKLSVFIDNVGLTGLNSQFAGYPHTHGRIAKALCAYRNQPGAGV